MKKLVYLSLGSNLGNPEKQLLEAIQGLAALGQVTKVSSFYETEPVEQLAQPWFTNCALEMKIEKTPRQFLAVVLKLEEAMGRRRTQEKGPRTIDIDILLFGNAIVHAPGLSIPHPAMHQRRFVLEPLAEIAPGLRHPQLKQTIRELRDALPSGQLVKKITTRVVQIKEE
jgi:2-amino-4-hydroxy-6-hydroxymethyldihydropteridine diphosphokinase